MNQNPVKSCECSLKAGKEKKHSLGIIWRRMGEFRACAKDPHRAHPDRDRVHLVPHPIPLLHDDLTCRSGK